MINSRKLPKVKMNDGDRAYFAELVKLILSLSHGAYREGILSLESIRHTLKPFILRKGIELVCEGIEAEALSGILDNYIEAGGYEGLELLEVLLAKEGVLLVQAGEDTRIVFEKLVSMLGEDFFIFIEKLELLKFVDEYQRSRVLAAWEEPDLDKLTFLLEEELPKIDNNKEMIQLIQRVGYINMATALLGVSRDVFCHVVELIGPYYPLHDLRNEINKQKPCTREDIIKAQKQVLYAVHF